MIKSKKTALIIMDGWGIGSNKSADAIEHANVPFYRSIHGVYPHSQLITCGEAVGLPEGQMGNSEVGHLNIGAGRVVYQELQRVNQAIKEKSLLSNEAFRSLVNYAKGNDKPVHLMGLVSDGGVHSHILHLKGVLQFLKQKGVKKVFVHAFTDGRDTDPKSGLQFIQQLEQYCNDNNATIASISGRYYAMDRDKRWERIRKAYEVLIFGKGQHAISAEETIAQAYKEGTTDEFILPTTLVDGQGQPKATIKEGDAVFCFNFRTDRCREISQVLTQTAFPKHEMRPLQIHYVTMTTYDRTYKNVGVIFPDYCLEQTMGEVLQQAGKTQIRVAETEKYPHVTYFFSGGREEKFKGEKRIIIPSPKVATYDLQPEMSAQAVTDAILPEIQHQTADFICLNFANPDMVGHTGKWEAVIKAVEKVDQCVKQLVQPCLSNDYTIFLTADHGNADYMKNEDNSVNTAHSLNPVPFFVISKEVIGKVSHGKLGDIAPTILAWMGLPIPKEMTGHILIESLR